MVLLTLLSLLQAFLAVVGIAWKASQGYALAELPNLARLFDPSCWLSNWLEDLGGVSPASLRDSWPWFSLHLFLYLGQLIPFAAIIEIKSPLPEKKFRAVTVLAILSAILGFAAAMPVVSLWIFWADERPCKRLSRGQRSALRTLAFFSTLTHVGAFLIALTAAWLGLVFSPWHVMNSLLSVPTPGHAGLSESSIRQARLRQINEMTGTSSGFFMAAGILLLVLESCRRRVTPGLVTWMFLVSLVAGPATGSAAVILLADEVTADETQSKGA
ncbi:hypothetical protein XA68_12255 [Ophiocordyceps unilateralis]|uniref:Uncharacterized protein n=1 Tax=Ophiocordyceps unilateralis TaxID=268505 RepID=A0A2A9PDB1_OPHUN|nr:hypothetical protein XA68_12255 [Ophiocordyceps unilateralis]